LKKLCIHVYNLIEEGTDQDTVIGQTLNISDLFERDINNLTAEESACIIDIAKESPADYFKIVETYGLIPLQSLINKRIVIRRSYRLILYWDIFRDYVLNKTIPTVIVDYIPQMQFTTIARVISVLLKNDKIEIQELATKSSLEISTIDNIMIDLTMFGLVSREQKTVKLLYTTNQEISKCMRAFFERHVVLVALKNESKGSFSYEAFSELFNQFYLNETMNERTRNTYCSKLINWLLNLNLIIEENHLFKINLNTAATIDISDSLHRLNRRRNTAQNNEIGHSYWPQVTPDKLFACYDFIKDSKQEKTDILHNGYKKAIEDLLTLKAISYNYEKMVFPIISKEELLERIKGYSNIKHSVHIYIENTNIKNNE